MLPLVLSLMNASGTYDEHVLYLQQARELWSALTPHERARAIERHVRAAASGERAHTARLVMLALRRDELLEQLRSVRILTEPTPNPKPNPNPNPNPKPNPNGRPERGTP